MAYSFSNFAMTALIAHHSSSRDFGVYSVLLATFLIGSGANRGLSAEPLIIDFSVAGEDAWRAASLHGLRRASGFGLVVGAALAAVTWAFLPSTFSPLGYVFAAAVPFLFAQDFLRYAALARGRPGAALANDLVVVAVQIGLVVVAITIGWNTASEFTAIWAVAGLAGGLVGLALLGLARNHGVSADDPFRRGLASRLGLDNAVTQLAQQGSGYAVAAVAGLAAAGGLRAAQTAFSPSAILSVGVQSAVIPELVRARHRSLSLMRRAMVLVGVALMIVSIAFAIVVPLLPDDVGASLLGPSWREARPVLVFIGLAQVFAVPTAVAQAGLRALGDGANTLRARLVGIVLFLGSTIPGAILGGVVGAGIGIVVGSALQSIVWSAFFGRSYREQEVQAAR